MKVLKYWKVLFFLCWFLSDLKASFDLLDSNDTDSLYVKTPFVFQKFDMSDGLPSNQANDIIEDEEGIMWFATNNGLCAYDGMRIKKYHLDDGSFQKSSALNSIEIDRKKNLWIGAKDGTIFKFNSSKNETLSISPLGNRNCDKQVRDLQLIADSMLLVIFTEAVFMIDINNHKIIELFTEGNDPNFFKRKYLHTISKDPIRKDVYWIGARSNYLFKLRAGNKELSTIKMPRGEQSGRIYSHTDGALYWIANPNRIAVYNPESKSIRFIPLPGERSQFRPEIAFKTDDQLWITTIHSGLGILNLVNDKIEIISSSDNYSFSLPKVELHNLYTDSKKDLWIGSINDGIFRWKNRYKSIKNYTPHSPQNQASTTIIDAEQVGKYILISEESEKGLILCDTAFRAIPNPPLWYKKMKLQIEFPRHLASGKNQLFVSTNKDIFRVDTASNTIQSILPMLGNDFKKFFTEYLEVNEKEELVLIGVNSLANNWSVVFLDSHSEHVDIYQVRGIDSNGNKKPKTLPYFTNIFDATQISDSIYVICGSSGLCLINRNQHTAELINDNLNPNIDNVIAVRFYQEKLYISFYAKGLKIADTSTQPWKIIEHKKHSGIRVDMVGKTLVDKSGLIWVMSYMGIHALDNMGTLIHSFDSSYGLPNDHLNFRNRQNIALIGEKYLFYGGLGNATFIDISSFKSEIPTSKIVVSDFKVNGTSLNPESLNDLGAKQNNISFYLSAPLSYSPEKILFEYKVGNSEFWEISETGLVQFHQLRPGKYNLSIQARSLINQNILGTHNFSFRINPPWYNTLWFYILLIVLCIGSVYFVYLSKIKAFKIQSKRQEAFEKQLQEVEMKALRSQMNPHFLFNSLNSIKNFITQNKPKEAAKHLTTFSKLMRMILSNSKEQLISLEDELSALRIYVELEAMRFEKVFSFNVDVDKDIDQFKCFVPPLILQPFVENAIWHGLLHMESKGGLEIKIKRKDAILNIDIEDNGIGREQAAKIRSKSATKHKSFGLEITKSRLDILEAKYKKSTDLKIIDLKNTDGQASGTKVSISIPFLKNQHHEYTNHNNR